MSRLNINGKDIARLMTDAEILEAVEQSMVAQGNGQTVIEADSCERFAVAQDRAQSYPDKTVHIDTVLHAVVAPAP